MRRIALPVLLTVAFACGDNETPPPAKGNYVGAAPVPLSCVPNLDGRIDANELKPILGATATTLVSPLGKPREVDTIGAQINGKRVWTLSQDYADDQVAKLTASSIKGKWYEGSFASLPDAVVTPVDAAGNTEGIYTHTDEAFSLHGLASKDDGPNRTLFVYKNPLQLYRFPLTVGATYTVTSDVENGIFQGLPYAGRDTYEVKVDASGELQLPDFTVAQALRVKIKVTVSPSAGTVVVRRQTQFLTECLGEVTRSTSNVGEENEDFTNASELRRRGLGL